MLNNRNVSSGSKQGPWSCEAVILPTVPQELGLLAAQTFHMFSQGLRGPPLRSLVSTRLQN